jgi:hypothetical protein
MLRATGATEDGASLLDAVADYPATAVSARRRQCVDRALKGIKDVLVTVHRHRKSLVILVATHIAFSHDWNLRIEKLMQTTRKIQSQK